MVGPATKAARQGAAQGVGWRFYFFPLPLPRLRSGLSFGASADGRVSLGRAGQFPLKAEKSPLLRVDDVGQSVIALRSAKTLLLF